MREICFVSEIDNLETSLCRDKNDVHILGLAQCSLAEYIITGDKDLLDLVEYKSAKIITPRELWTLLKTPFPEVSNG
ncbi:MAG: putative toxin-antitoxin system toxin component, PIN family [Proteobacteria bacterium]|nr:putative toxin-antitoxin system toxin component, PIN family [Pseudomonadota bacterium]